MLQVKTPEEVLWILKTEFPPRKRSETVTLSDACGRVLAADICSGEYIPDFSRSTMDGFAVMASDTFGCSESIPAVLTLTGTVEMGKMPRQKLEKGCCIGIPTGGALPEGADAVVMLEHTELYGDGTVGVLKACSPGSNLIFRGDDLVPGQKLLEQGRKLRVADIGSLASLGITEVPVLEKITVGIISTGDELVEVSEKPSAGQVRNINSGLLKALVEETGAAVLDFGIVRDSKEKLEEALDRALENCDTILVSGGSSAGAKDQTAEVLGEKGELLFHGIAIKPGKPTMLARIGEKAVFGIAGHPGAAYFAGLVFVRPFLKFLLGEKEPVFKETAILTESVDANHGRTQYTGVRLFEADGELYAEPVISKSGLITAFAGIDAYTVVGRNAEGIKKGSRIEVYRVF